MASPRRLLLPLATLAALAAAAPAARADDMVAELARDTPIAAYGGQLAYSSYDTASGRYTLMIAPRGGTPAAAAVPTSQRAFDVSLGPDAKGRVVALYTRCRSGEKRCDIYRYTPSVKYERRLGFSSPREDEAWPAQWGNRVVFVRRHLKGGKGEIPNCDVPYVKTLTSPAPPRRLDRGSCATTTGLSLRQNRIVQVTFGSPPGARFESQVRVLSTRGGGVKVVARQGSGEESNEFVSPNQAPDAIWLTRTGVNPEPTFVLIDLKQRRPKPREVRAQTELTGAFARDNQSGTFWYVEGTGFRGDGCAQEEPTPCRLVRASVNPFSPLPRALLPTLTITAPTETTPVFLYGDPFVLSGRLTRKIVHFGVVGRTDPIAGVPVALLARVPGPAQAAGGESFRPTGIVATTDADGRWSTTLATPPSQPAFSAVASSATVPATYAGRGTAGTVGARIALTVSGTSFAGTIAPAQPGRTVKIQRLLSRKCQTVQSGQQLCNDKWATVGEAPVDAAGTGYAATVAAPQPGIYTAVLPFEDLQKDPAAYGGRSPDVPVG
jgi:hypothetical protein